jgi:amyloid beta precursor protein binding protein 1
MFTIADAATVTEVDLGVNFFLDEESLGKSRAECCVNLLKELNPDVRGESISLEKVLVVGIHEYIKADIFIQ